MKIEIVYRLIKTKQFSGKDAKRRAEEYANLLKLNNNIEDINAYEITHSTGGVRAYFDVNNMFERVEMDG